MPLPLKYRWIPFFFALCVTRFSVAQPNLDSAKKQLDIPRSDSSLMMAYAYIGNEHYNRSELDSSLRYSLLALRMAERLDIKWQIIVLNNHIGGIYDITGNHQRAMECYLRVLKLSTRINDIRGLASAYGNLGIVFYYRANYPMALDMQLRALEYFRQAKDTMGEARTADNIGIVYQSLGDYTKALDYHRLAEKWYVLKRHTRGLANLYNNMANIYLHIGEKEKAYDFYLRSLRYHLEIGDELGYAACLSNLAMVLSSRKELQKSVDSLQKALGIQKRINDVAGEAITRLALGNSFFAMDRVGEAEKEFLLSMELARQIADRETARELYLNLSQVYERKGQSKKALQYFDSYLTLHDSLSSEENYGRTVKLEMDYEFENREKAARLQHEKEVVVEKERQQKNVYLIACMITALCLSFAFGWYVWWHNRLMNRCNRELELQKKLVEEKQTEILDSIRYAGRIQRALLPKMRFLEKHLSPKQ